jgi:hypothetical protein
LSTWTTQTLVDGTPEDVLAVLSDPEACFRWSPIEFQLEDLDGERLRTGSRARVAGHIAGISVAFEIDVQQADEGRLALTARGPLTLEVSYEAYPVPEDRAELSATVTVRSASALRGRLAAASTEALLRAGVLSAAVKGIAREVGARVNVAAGC